MFIMRFFFFFHHFFLLGFLLLFLNLIRILGNYLTTHVVPGGKTGTESACISGFADNSRRTTRRLKQLWGDSRREENKAPIFDGIRRFHPICPVLAARIYLSVTVNTSPLGLHIWTEESAPRTLQASVPRTIPHPVHSSLTSDKFTPIPLTWAIRYMLF